MEPPQSSPSSSSSKFCNECKTNEFKYKCPGCSLRSCSLTCVKSHKQRTGCTGKRQQITEFVPLSKFDDNLLLSDYNMLEDVKRVADSAKRRRVGLCGKYDGISFGLKNLLKAARNRRIKLMLLPNGMSMRLTNKTSYDHRLKSISWTIEWRFHSTNVKLIDHGVHENSNICSVIQKHLKPGPTNRPLKPFYLEPVESLKFYISKHPKQPRSPVRELDINAPLHEQLGCLVIIEYPVIHIFLPSHSPDVKVIKAIVSQQVQPETDPVNGSQPGPEGTFFKEEEINDNDSADPHVLDLADKSNSKTQTKDEGFIHKSLDSTENDSAKRRVSLCGNYPGISFDLENLLKAARTRKIKLISLPNGMSMRFTNKTSYDHRSKSISWTIEWRFHSTNVMLIDHGVHENSNLCSVIQKHLKPGPTNHPLKPFYLEPVESLKFYISKHPKQPRSPVCELDINAPLGEQLGNFVIIEYPVIHVFLPSHSPDVEVINAIVSQQVQPKTDPVNDSQSCPEGVFVKEEEIKDYDSADPLVLDLVDKSNCKTETKDEECIHESLDSTENDNELSDPLTFDFEPELIDVYSSLISETNPDDFLDFDGLCDDLPSKEDDKYGVIKEELEEGEIADSD